MDIACFRRSCEHVSGKAASLVLGGSVCWGGGGKCLEFAAKWFTFPGKNGKMAVESTFPAGKCLGFAVIWFTFREEQTRNGRSGYG